MESANWSEIKKIIIISSTASAIKILIIDLFTANLLELS